MSLCACLCLVCLLSNKNDPNKHFCTFFVVLSTLSCVNLESNSHIWNADTLLYHSRTVVKCSIAKSQALYSAQRGLKNNNAAVFKVGAIMINIPQHPATLHSMMVRSSHQLSKQISDLIRQPSNV